MEKMINFDTKKYKEKLLKVVYHDLSIELKLETRKLEDMLESNFLENKYRTSLLLYKDLLKKIMKDLEGIYG